MLNHKNAVLQGLHNMREYDCIGNGIVYVVSTLGGTQVGYTTDQMIREIERGTEVGNTFSQSIYDTIISYMGKFTQHNNEVIV